MRSGTITLSTGLRRAPVSRRDGYLLVVYEDGDSYLYYRQGLDNPYHPPETETSVLPDDDPPIG